MAEFAEAEDSSTGLRRRAREVPESSGAKPKSERFDPLNQTRGATFEEEYAQVNRDLDEPENPQRRTWLSLVFLVLFTTPAIAASFLTAREWADPLVRIVAPDDTDQVQDGVLVGSKPRGE